MRKGKISEKRIALLTVSVFLLSAMLGTLFITPVVADPGTIKVPDDYLTLQAAIDAASPGDTIHVAAGTYYEHVFVNKPLKLVGENRTTTIIDGSGTKNVILVAADDVSISGFTIQNGGEVHLGELKAGIFLEHVIGSMIVNNNVSNNNGFGIFVMWGNDNDVLNNIVTFNGLNGIRVDVSRSTLVDNIVDYNNESGIFLSEASDCLIEKNTASNNGWSGIQVDNGINITIRDNTAENNKRYGITHYGSVACSTEGNTISNDRSNSEYGISISFSNDSIISHNTITSNSGEGIHLSSSDGNIITRNNVSSNGIGIYLSLSSNNTIHHNNFVDNEVQHTLEGIALNTWDNGAEGNYWSDYKGEDLDGNGIGDTLLPHLEVDYYPLMEPWGLTRTFRVVWEGVTHYLTTFSNSTVAGLDFSQPLKQISFNVTGPSGAYGYCNVTIPIELLGGTFTVLIDDTSMDYILSQNATHSFLYFTYTYSTHNVRIIGTTVIPDTTPPTANAGPDQTVNEDTLVIFDGSGSWDSVGIIDYTWAFTDVTLQALTGMNPTYNFATPGTYIVTLNVTNAAENYATDTVEITVLDVTSPVADAGSDQTVSVDTSVSLDAGGSTDNVGIVSYEWEFGDGTTGTGETTTHTYSEAGTHTVTLTVADGGGNSDTDTSTITIEEEPGFPWMTVGIGVAIAAIVVVAAVYLLVTRKRS